ncbi:cyclic di-GMP phosphodiesterase [Abditibacteriota bacterium]|nr:cyclic di-GMP phosphodiesterase [Abditibacteriota bacterium]
MKDPEPTSSVPTSGALAALETTRAALSHGFEDMRAGILSQSTEIEVLRQQLKQAQGRIAELEDQCGVNEQTKEQLRMEVAKREGDLVRQNVQLVEAERAHDEARNENARLNGQLVQVSRKLENARERNRDLQDQLLDFYAELRSADLPHLALRLAAGLTGAESGLFTEVDGDGTLATFHLTEMEKKLVDALYNYSRQVAHSEEPLVENDSSKLPDGAGLVNLAALPVAAKGKLRGVLLLCNKRAGDFDDEDTQLLLAIGQHAGLALENSRLHAELNDAYAATIAVLADAIEAKDAYTRGHCEGVSRLAVEVARRLELTDAQLEQARYAALLHDVGKIGVPDGILLKPTKLIPEEFMIIQKHPQIGRDIVSRVSALSNLSDAILHHHEKWDGSGYPSGLAGEGIPLLARIVGAVDAFDAMTTPRPYRNPVPQSEAIEEMRRCAGTQFDPQIVELVAQIVSAN